MDLNTPLTSLKGVGEKIGKRLIILGLNTVEDLILYFPFRYDDFTKTVKIKDLPAGIAANVVGQIELIENRRAHHRRMAITEALVNDGTETLKIIWFNQPFITKNLKVGDTVSFAGTAIDEGVLTMISPIYEKVSGNQMVHTQGLVPNYHLTEKITQKQLRFLISQVIGLSEKIPDLIPAITRKKLNLLDLGEAIKKIHFPKTWDEVGSARRRLAFDELFLMQLKSRLIKNERDKAQAEIVAFKEKETKELVDSLPFKLTEDQRQASWSILQDMGKPRPMARLLNGDVGSGKTLVAILALFNVALNNKQAVLMAPTEILAQQHFNTVSKLLKNFPLKIALLTNNYRLLNTSFCHFEEAPATEKSLKAGLNRPPLTPPSKGGENISRAEMLKIIKAGEIDIIIGTHALVQEDVKFKNLALAVIDEQHRFGVNQRKTLMEKSGQTTPAPSLEGRGVLTPHLLSMTATPIPRSLALALFGDLDISIIKQMPIGRKPIITKIVPEEKRSAAYDFIRQQIKAGRQAFVICPLVEESDFFGVKSVKEEFAKLDKFVFPEIKMAALHGQMKAKVKEETMRGFLTGDFKILVSTSVVEVGVDVPNATIMMIEGAERFGLSQLHQFRGRVGRGAEQSYCFLFPTIEDPKVRQRLEAMEKISDGFILAKTDLKLRGSGEIFGTAQSGFPELKIATLWDYELLKQAQEEAGALLLADPELKKNPALRQEINIFEETVHLE